MFPFKTSNQHHTPCTTPLLQNRCKDCVVGFKFKQLQNIFINEHNLTKERMHCLWLQHVHWIVWFPILVRTDTYQMWRHYIEKSWQRVAYEIRRFWSISMHIIKVSDFSRKPFCFRSVFSSLLFFFTIFLLSLPLGPFRYNFVNSLPIYLKFSQYHDNH